MPARLECVMIGGKVEDTDAFLRRLRRVGRTQGGNQRAHGIIYLSATSRKLAQKTLDDHAAGILKAGETPPDLSTPILITAPCKVIAQNEIYNNPPSDPQCTCPPCISNPPAVRAARASKVNTNIPKAKQGRRVHYSSLKRGYAVFQVPATHSVGIDRCQGERGQINLTHISVTH
ncbi:hypothetical protein B0H14DRAFT_3427286 [Mycena olivaceomarginata]|nr:hypothetical protein B0H14DRAFT_3427286 [Mycena olivaceomarginata]